jgi:hypothetical protein
MTSNCSNKEFDNQELFVDDVVAMDLHVAWKFRLGANTFTETKDTRSLMS